MSEVFAKFREMLGSRQRATLAYRPQANGQQERSVQTVNRAVRAYVAEPDQSDWDDQVEKLMWALNMSLDATRLDTPFYLVHGWDPQSTVSAMLGPRPAGVDQRTAYEWRRGVQRQYEYAQAWAKDLQAQAKAKRSEAQTKTWQELSERLKKGFAVGDAVWLYLARVHPGLTKKFAHLWHGPFRILETSNDFRCKLKIQGSGYKLYPWVHVSRLKPRVLFPDRPTEEIEVAEEDDFDAALLAEDVDDPDEAQSEYEVESIPDVRWVKRTRTSKRVREDLVKWKGYSEPDWLPMSQLNCGALFYDFNKGAKAQARFKAMQAGDELPEPEAQEAGGRSELKVSGRNEE
ncbi:hypothetical protein PF002_g3904 [Phytophthora fragariae]|uniref:Chromo domain-containing protein n=1 Tax=Phytophthora fragariae TaxID=53985 RepID=A0A6A4ABA0_9STRA|nr:hypothetical protein PF002_g3904 [Phytophthora fragariae]